MLINYMILFALSLSHVCIHMYHVQLVRNICIALRLKIEVIHSVCALFPQQRARVPSP